MSSTLKSKRAPLMETGTDQPSPTHSAPLAMDEEDVGDERAAEGDALLFAHVLAEVAERAAPRFPAREHHLDLGARRRRARRVRTAVAVRSLRRAGVAFFFVAVVVHVRAEPALQRAERDHDSVREVLELHVGMLLAQLDDEVAKGIAVSQPLRAAVDAAGVMQDVGVHRAAERERHVGRSQARRCRWAADGTLQRGQHREHGVAQLVRAAARRARRRDHLRHSRARQVERAEVLSGGEQHPGDEHRGGWRAATRPPW